MQRALAFEWPGMPEYASIADQFLWGEAFLIALIVSQTDNTNRSRAVILPFTPAGLQSWICFWTGEHIAATLPGKTFQAHAPINYSPVFVRVGSIVPLGPYLQHTGEHPADPLEIRIYSGADGSFSLYEDDGKSPQPCASSTIQMDWDDGIGTLTVRHSQGCWRHVCYTLFLSQRAMVWVWSLSSHQTSSLLTLVQCWCVVCTLVVSALRND